MRNSLKCLLVFIVAGSFSACGDYSNPQLQEDLEFLSAIPDKKVLDLRVAPKLTRDYDGAENSQELTERQDALGEKATWYEESRDMTEGVNQGVLGYLELVDFITKTFPPTTREAGRRIWGPWPSDDTPTMDVRFVMSKDVEPGDFLFAFQFRAADQADQFTFDEGWVSCVSGDVRPRGLFRRGVGSLTINLDNCSSVTGAADTGTARGIFETSPDAENPLGKTDLTVSFTDFLTQDDIDKDPDARPNSFIYYYKEQSDLSGAYDFSLESDIHNGDPGLEADELFEFQVRWESNGCGRADFRISGDDLGGFQVLASECWDENHNRVFYTDNAGIEDSEGSELDCCRLVSDF
jgi:hypothetical protein